MERNFGQAQTASGMISGANPAQPKEIGFIQRIEGIRSGMDEIYSRLRTFSDRISGSGNTENNPKPIPAGIPGNLSECEERIRQLLTMVGTLEQSF